MNGSIDQRIYEKERKEEGPQGSWRQAKNLQSLHLLCP